MSQSRFDPGGVLKNVHDEANQSLRVSADLLISSESDNIQLGDGINLVSTTVVGEKVGLDTTIVGGIITPTGLRTGLFTQTVTITDVASKVPATALTNRNNITIRVWGEKIVYFGDSSVTSSTGYPKFQYEEISMDLKDDAAVEVWAVCAAGESCVLKIMEIA